MRNKVHQLCHQQGIYRNTVPYVLLNAVPSLNALLKHNFTYHDTTSINSEHEYHFGGQYSQPHNVPFTWIRKNHAANPKLQGYLLSIVELSHSSSTYSKLINQLRSCSPPKFQHCRTMLTLPRYSNDLHFYLTATPVSLYIRRMCSSYPGIVVACSR